MARQSRAAYPRHRRRGRPDLRIRVLQRRQARRALQPGPHQGSRDNNVMQTIVEDTYRDHDLQWGMCSAWVFESVRRKYNGMAETFPVDGPLGIPPFGCYESPAESAPLSHLNVHGLEDVEGIGDVLRADRPRLQRAVPRHQEIWIRPGDWPARHSGVREREAPSRAKIVIRIPNRDRFRKLTSVKAAVSRCVII